MVFRRLFRRRKSREEIAEITKAIEEIKGREKVIRCSFPSVLSDVDIEALLAKYGFRSEYTMLSTKLGYSLICDYWCLGELGKKVIADLEEARNVSDKAFEALVLLFSFTIHTGICLDKKYEDDPFCIHIKPAINILRGVATSMAQTNYSMNIISIIRRLRKINKETKHDARIFHELNRIYKEEMRKAGKR